MVFQAQNHHPHQHQQQEEDHVHLGEPLASTLAAFHRAIQITLDLFHTSLSFSVIELEEPSPLPFGSQKYLDLKTGEIYYTNRIFRG